MRLPEIRRDPCALEGHTGALEVSCAIDWYEFLADEAYFNDDVVSHDRFKAHSDRLKRSPYGYLHSNELESLIKQYKKD